MQPSSGIVTYPSPHSVAETLDRLQDVLHEKSIKIFIRIDQAKEAASVGLAMPPTELLIFGSPRAGTPIMLAAPLSAIDLPLKALAWQDASGHVWLTYSTPDYLQMRFSLDDQLIAPLKSIDGIIRQALT